MKFATPLVLLLVSGVLWGQDDVEAKKKRLGELIKQMNQIKLEGDRLVQELTGGDPEKTEALMREIMRQYAPELAAPMERAATSAREMSAAASLKTLAIAEADFRANDRDGNRVNDFWVADVSGLYRIDPGNGPIGLVEQSVAMADARPCLALEKSGRLPGVPKEHASQLGAVGKAAPKNGYWFAAVEKYQDEKGAEVRYDEGNGRNRSAFGLCAYPAEYGKTGKFTFLLGEENVLWRKDTGGKPVLVFPKDPAKAGWGR
jgi:hypothetical protein